MGKRGRRRSQKSSRTNAVAADRPRESRQHEATATQWPRGRCLRVAGIFNIQDRVIWQNYERHNIVQHVEFSQSHNFGPNCSPNDSAPLSLGSAVEVAEQGVNSIDINFGPKMDQRCKIENTVLKLAQVLARKKAQDFLCRLN